MRIRRGQALMELAFGLFALALVVSALCGFAVCIATSLREQNALRAGLGTGGGSNSRTDTIAVDEFAANYLFGKSRLELKERVEFPRP